jgi:hypothetical protein
MQNYSYDDTIYCPQITSVIVLVLKLLGALGIIIPSHGNVIGVYGFLVDPVIALILTIFIILGIKNKNYGFYICAQVTSIIMSILGTILILIIFVFILFFAETVEKWLNQVQNTVDKNIPNVPNVPNQDINKTINESYKLAFSVFKTAVFIGLSIRAFIIWLLTCVLICYNKRVRYHCDNITAKQIGSMINQPLV